ncbi:MAG: hypothetical protein RL375_1511 [Pseudomonadota bacterium]|jgi:hypothetical protein
MSRAAPAPTSGGLVPLVAAVLIGVLSPAWAQSQIEPPPSGIYTCVDSQGRRITSDRPIRECLDREQAELNRDGSTRRKLPPSLTADERAAAEEAARRKFAAEASRNDAIRRDRNLMARYKEEAAHNKARESALDVVRKSVKSSQQRLVELEGERKALQAEAEFYKGKDLPRQLKLQFEANAATAEATRSLVATHEAELNRVTAVYDGELARLRKLWAGAAPGSLGPTGSEVSSSK